MKKKPGRTKITKADTMKMRITSLDNQSILDKVYVRMKEIYPDIKPRDVYALGLFTHKVFKWNLLNKNNIHLRFLKLAMIKNWRRKKINEHKILKK